MEDYRELRRVATHEASHAVMAWLLGATAQAGPVSIVPGLAFDGVAFFGRARLPTEADLSGLSRPYPLVPATLRRFYESVVMALLAGQVGEALYAPSRGEEPCPAPGEAYQESGEVPVLPVREQVILAEAAARDERDSDMAKCMTILAAIHYDDDRIAQRHLGFLSAETESILSAMKAGLLVRELAGQLMIHRTLSASRWKATLRAAA